MHKLIKLRTSTKTSAYYHVKKESVVKDKLVVSQKYFYLSSHGEDKALDEATRYAENIEKRHNQLRKAQSPTGRLLNTLLRKASKVRLFNKTHLI